MKHVSNSYMTSAAIKGRKDAQMNLEEEQTIKWQIYQNKSDQRIVQTIYCSSTLAYNKEGNKNLDFVSISGN